MGTVRYRRWAAAILAAAFFFSLNAAWIPAKAELAQLLLEGAWQRRQGGAPNPRPWPWADTSPVGVLEAPGLGVRQLVLEGASGRNLAFGPSAVTGIDAADLVLSGHRDTHFAWLSSLESGDRLRLVRTSGTRDYRVAQIDVVDSRRQQLVLDRSRDRLTLVTCYPFDAVSAGGSLRYVVTAMPVEAGVNF